MSSPEMELSKVSFFVVGIPNLSDVPRLVESIDLLTMTYKNPNSRGTRGIVYSVVSFIPQMNFLAYCVSQPLWCIRQFPSILCALDHTEVFVVQGDIQLLAYSIFAA